MQLTVISRMGLQLWLLKSIIVAPDTRYIVVLVDSNKIITSILGRNRIAFKFEFRFIAKRFCAFQIKAQGQ